MSTWAEYNIVNTISTLPTNTLIGSKNGISHTVIGISEFKSSTIRYRGWNGSSHVYWIGNTNAPINIIADTITIIGNV